jgi:hypothetical protein
VSIKVFASLIKGINKSFKLTLKHQFGLLKKKKYFLLFIISWEINGQSFQGKWMEGKNIFET